MDRMLRAIAAEGGARVVAVETTGVAEKLRTVHSASPTMTAALGRAATGALLLAASLEKVTEKEPIVTLEIEGNGPAGKIIATASPAGWVRATAKNTAADPPPKPNGKLDVGAAVGREGTFAVARDLGIGQPYRGVVPLAGGEIGLDLATYLKDSEQTPTAVLLGVRVAAEGRVLHSGGLLVQLMPGFSEERAIVLESRLSAFGELTRKMQAGAGPAEWIDEIFAATAKVEEETPVRFHCGCSRDRVERALKLLGAKEVGALMRDAESRPARIVCEFCRTPYDVPRDDLARLLLELEREAPPAARA